MPSFNFVIPSNREDLLSRTAGQYYVEEVYSTRKIPVKIQEAKPSLHKSAGLDITQHFDAFYSVVTNFIQLDVSTKQVSWTILTKVCELFTNELSKFLHAEADDQLNEMLQTKYLNALKMNIYLLTQMIDSYLSLSRKEDRENSTTTKNKKSSKAKSSTALGIDWESECQRSVHILMSVFDLDIHRLWNAQLVEDELTSLVCNLCFKILEDPTMVKSKLVKSSVLNLLGCIIKKHNQSLSASLKVVQMLQHFDHSATPMAEAVHMWASTYKCRSIVSEVLRELSHIPERDFIRDSSSTKTICSFIVELSYYLPDAVLLNISLLLPRMDEESYMMRNSVLGAVGEIIIQCLSKEGLDEKSKQARDQFLDILYDHANLDVNAFVRSRALHVWLNLVSENSLPVKRCPDLVELCVRLLLDKSNLVRKVSVQLLEALLRKNPFRDNLTISPLQCSLKQEQEKLEELQSIQDEKNEENKSKENEEILEEGMQEDDVEKNDENGSGSEEEQTENEKQDLLKTQEPNLEIEKKKEIIEYLSNAINFVERFNDAVPVLCQLLNSRTQSDVVEAINFFTAAWEFQLGCALEGITGMLEQIWNEDQKIRDAVVSAYRKLYFKTDSNITSKVKTVNVADNMIKLVAGSSNAKLPAIECLIGEIQKSGDWPSAVAQICWDRLTNPLASFAIVTGLSEMKQRKVSIQLLGMLANKDANVIKSKIKTLVSVGLKERTLPTSENVFDFELPFHTCVALSKLAAKKTEAGKYMRQFRYPDDHQLITTLTSLVVSGFNKKSVMWVKFALEAVGVIFQLSDNPVVVSTSMLNEIKGVVHARLSSDEPSGEIPVNELLMRFYSIIGQFALKLLVFIEGDVQSEIKQNRKLQEENEEADKNAQKKNKSSGKDDSHLEDDMGVGGATADDADQEFIKNVLETEIVEPDTPLGSLSEWLVRCCTVVVEPSDHSAVRVQQTASLALAKFMLVSSKFCERHLRLLFTMLEQSPHEGIRANLTIAAGDLSVRFPNLLEPWTSHIYARLNDKSVMVKVYATKVLTNLILNDMIKVKGHVSEMARCIVDENEKISAIAKRFFQELAKKGNSMYNVMPDIISRLSDPDIGIKDEVDFKKIMRFLLEYIQKDKQTESLIEKLCHRLEATRDKQQRRDLAFCLSILNYTEKGVKKLYDNFSLYANVLRDEQVYFLFNNILTKCKKCAKPDVKSQVDELEGKIIDRHACDVSEDECAAKAAEAVRSRKPARSPSVNQNVRKSARKSRPQIKMEVSDESSDGEPDTTNRPIRRHSMRSRVTRHQAINFSSDDEEDSDDSKENTVTPNSNVDEISNSGSEEVSPVIREKTTKTNRSVLRV
nr:condensin complex subunit 1 isoform X2 [Ciona intestinalis]|eukprot:XP_009862227.1 condensin complex subunit 1 isoform X2 [Ciona intestinalis]